MSCILEDNVPGMASVPGAALVPGASCMSETNYASLHGKSVDL
jgi:hypothetical protein